MNKKNKAKHIPAKVKVPKPSTHIIDEIREVKEEPVTEYIQWAAIRGVNGDGNYEVIKGWCHSNIHTVIKDRFWDKIILALQEEGFLTNEGRFVNRSEAHEIAFGKPGYLESWMINDDPRYGKE